MGALVISGGSATAGTVSTATSGIPSVSSVAAASSETSDGGAGVASPAMICVADRSSAEASSTPGAGFFAAFAISGKASTVTASPCGGARDGALEIEEVTSISTPASADANASSSAVSAAASGTAATVAGGAMSIVASIDRSTGFNPSGL